MLNGAVQSAPARNLSGLWNRRRALFVLGAMGLVYFFSYFQRTAIPGTIFDRLQSEMALSASAVTGLGALFLYIYAGMQLFVGMAADRYGGTRMLLLGGLVMAAGSLLFPLAHSLPLLYLGRALTGFGGSFMYVSIIREIDERFGSAYFSWLIGPMLFIGYSGGLAALSPFNWAVTKFGWRETLLAVGVGTVVALVVAAVAFRGMPPPAAQTAPFSLRPLWSILANRRAQPLLACSLINFPIYFVIQATLGNKFLQDVAGMSPSRAALCMLLMMAVNMVLVFFGGTFMHWTNQRRKPILLIAVLLILVSTLLMSYGVWIHAPGGLFLACYLLLAASIASSPASISLMRELNPPDVTAQAIAVTNCCAYIGTAVLANLAGAVLDHFRDRATVTLTGTIYPDIAYLTLFLLLAGLACVSLIFNLFIPETNGRRLEETVEE